MSARPSLKLLELEEMSPTRFRVQQADESPEGHDVVFGGQLLAQTIAASTRNRDENEYVKSIHTIFSRAGSYLSPIELEVEVIQSGRTWASQVVTAWQNEKILTRSLLLLTKDEPDLIRHQAYERPDTPVPDAGAANGLVFPGAQYHPVAEPAAGAGEGPTLQLWTRMPAATGPAPTRQAVLSWATNGWFIGLAMQAHPDEVNVSDAHRTIATGVIGHTINFHDDFDPDSWVLLTHESTWAGRGRTHGRGLAFSEDGRLVASFSQDSMIKSAGERTGTSKL